MEQPYREALENPETAFVVVVEGGLVTNVLFREGEERPYLILDWDSFADATEEDPDVIGMLADARFPQAL